MESLSTALAPGERPEQAFSLTAAMALEHVGRLLGFLEAHLQEFTIPDPDAKVQTGTVMDGIKVGRMVCEGLSREGDPAVLRDLWPQLVEAVVERRVAQGRT